MNPVRHERSVAGGPESPEAHPQRARGMKNDDAQPCPNDAPARQRSIGVVGWVATS